MCAEIARSKMKRNIPCLSDHLSMREIYGYGQKSYEARFL
jgi:hypothetical protein